MVLEDRVSEMKSMHRRREQDSLLFEMEKDGVGEDLKVRTKEDEKFEKFVVNAQVKGNILDRG